MHTPTRRIFTALALAVALAAQADAPPAPVPSVEDGQVVVFKDVKWSPLKIPEGAPITPGIMVSRVAGDGQTGPSLAYAKYPPGYVFPAHTHSFAEYTVSISGTTHFTMNGKTYTLTSGSYVVIPPKTVHSVTCAAGAECVTLIRRAGATDYQWVK